MKANLLLIAGLTLLVAGVALYSIALAMVIAGVALIALSFAFTDDKPKPEDQHL